MRTRYRVWLNGAALDALDPCVCILAVTEGAPKIDTSTTDKALGDGVHVNRTRRKTMDVTVRFAMTCGGMTHRASLLDQVRAWCRPGWLSCTTRPGKRLYVHPTSLPDVSSYGKTTVYQLTLTAYEWPWWESAAASAATIDGTGEKQLYVEGTAESTVCTFTAENTADAVCSALTIRAGDTCFAFEQLGLAKGERLTGAYTERGYLQLTIIGTDGASRSAHAMRTPESDDELLVKCGASNVISVTAPAGVTTTVTARGRWV